MHIEFLDAGDVIKIEGPPSDAEKAKEILESQANELVTKMDFCEIDVDAKYHKHIIGKGGSTGMYKLRSKHAFFFFEVETDAKESKLSLHYDITKKNPHFWANPG